MKNTNRKKVLVIAAHPDDEVLGCGATIARHVEAGDRVWILILGEGITSRRYLSAAERRKSLNKLHQAARRANKVLGAERLILRGLPDNKFDGVALLKIVHTVDEIIDDFEPHIIYTHNGSDVNIDHRRTLEAVEASARPMSITSLEQMLAFETPSSTEWNFTRYPFHPNVFHQLSVKNIERKLEAMRIYSSEMRPFPHPRSVEYLKLLAGFRGVQAGYKLAEAFELVYWRN